MTARVQLLTPASASPASASQAAESREFWLAVQRADRVLSRADTAALRACGLTVTQYIAMMGLANSLGESAAHMARCLGVSPQAAHALVKRLLAQGYLQRSGDEHSEVVVLNRLTPRGRAAARDADHALVQLEAQRRETLGASVYDEVLRTLAPLVRLTAIGGTAEQRDAQVRLESTVKGRLGASVRHLASGYVDDVARELRGAGITAAQYFVLAQLRDASPQTTSQIVAGAGVPQQTGSSAVAGLMRMGAISLQESGHHLGLALRALTPRGREIFDQAWRRVYATTVRITECLDEQRLRRATQLLHTVREQL